MLPEPSRPTVTSPTLKVGEGSAETPGRGIVDGGPVAAMLERWETITGLCDHSDMQLDYPDMCRACEYAQILDAAAPYVARSANIRAARTLVNALQKHGDLISDELFWELTGVALAITRGETEVSR